MKRKLKIGGMHCSSCVFQIEKALKKNPHVSEAAVNLATETLVIHFDEKNLSVSDIESMIKQSGFQVLHNQTEQILKISGMSCAACASAIEKKLKQLEGVDFAKVNLATEQLLVRYDANFLSIDSITSQVKNLGYTISSLSKENLGEDEKEKELERMKMESILSVVFGSLLLFISMVPMISFLSFLVPKALQMQLYPLRYALIQLFLIIPVCISGRKFFISGFRSFLQKTPTMNSLVAISSGSAILYSLYQVYLIAKGHHEAVHGLYFESAATIIMFIQVGKLMEAKSKRKASLAMRKLMELAPQTARIWKNETEKIIPIDDLIIGDRVVMRPGEKIPADGIILEGKSSINESMLTGESMPVDKSINDLVFAGSMNLNGSFHFRAEKVKEQTTLFQMIRLVEEAQASKAPIAKLADIISSYFVPAVCVIAVLSAVLWWFAKGDLEFSLQIFISVLVIACPCALGLATPTAIMVGTGVGAEHGILFKHAEAIEIAQSIKTVVFDKTGTLTTGSPTLTDIISPRIPREEILRLCASAEKNSEHPLGKALVQQAEEEKINVVKAEDFFSEGGMGVRAIVDQMGICIGNETWINNQKIDVSSMQKEEQLLAAEGKTPVYVACNDQVVAVLGFRDTLKPESVSACMELKALGLQLVMMTGDHEKTAKSFAKQLQIDQVFYEVLPKDKSDLVKRMQKNNRTIAMVGDGINDAPALAQADLGIAVTNATDIAMESADIVLMKQDLRKVASAIKLSRATMRNIRQNLFWAFVYNIAGIPIAAGCLYLFGGPLLNPMIAAAAMSLSSVSVVSNALRIYNIKMD